MGDKACEHLIPNSPNPNPKLSESKRFPAVILNLEPQNLQAVTVNPKLYKTFNPTLCNLKPIKTYKPHSVPKSSKTDIT